MLARLHASGADEDRSPLPVHALDFLDNRLPPGPRVGKDLLREHVTHAGPVLRDPHHDAGIAIVNGKKAQLVKDRGNVAHLKEVMKKRPPSGCTGIAHTRWATHGAPSQVNAHPHTDQANRIAVVHNGIIENDTVLKEKLKKEGVRFRSETDTEVLSQLIGKYYTNGDLAAAVRRALLDIEARSASRWSRSITRTS